MISYFKRTLKDEKVRELKNFQVGSWVYVVNPTDNEIEYLIRKFRLDENNLISGLDQNEIPRVDFVKKDAYVFIKTVSPSGQQLDTCLIIISRHFILTLSKDEPNFFRAILKGRIRFITTQKLRCLIRLFFFVNKEFEKLTLQIVRVVNARKALTHHLATKDVRVLLEKEDILNGLISCYNHMNLLYERIIKKMRFFEEDREIIEDLIVEANQGYNLGKFSLKTISNIRDYYTILLTNRLSKTMAILTIFTIFITIPGAISGIYGMNVRLPFQGDPAAFYYVLAATAAILFLLFYYLKKKKIF